MLVKRRSRRVRTFLSVNKRRDTEGRGGEAESADIYSNLKRIAT